MPEKKPPATIEVKVSLLIRLLTWMRARSLWVRLLLYLLVSLAVTAGAYVLFRATRPDTFTRELSIALLGAVVTLIPAVGLASLALYDQWRRAREIEFLARFSRETWQQQSIRAGRMKIPDIFVVASGNSHSEWTDRVDVEFTDFVPSRPRRPDVDDVIRSRLPGLLADAARHHIALVDESCVDLVSCRVGMRRDPAGRRRPIYRLTPAHMTYFDFVATAADLDVTVGDDPRSLRQRFGFTPQSLEDVAALAVPAKIGSGTLVVTRDRRLVLGVRGRTMIASRHDTNDQRELVHVVAEGMLPDDLGHHGLLDPRRTAERALFEEVGIGEARDSIGRVQALASTGIFFDQLRWQPCFAHVAFVDLTWDEFQTAVPAAMDYWEVERYFSLPFDIANPGVRRLLLGSHPDLVLASNHAAAVLWFALVFEHGFTTMRDALSRPPGALSEQQSGTA